MEVEVEEEEEVVDLESYTVQVLLEVFDYHYIQYQNLIICIFPKID